MVKHSEKTYFQFAEWLSFNGYSYSIDKERWLSTVDPDNKEERTTKDLFKEFINDITNTH